MDLLRGRPPWSGETTPWSGYREKLVSRIKATKLRLDFNGSIAHISTGFGPPSNVLLMICHERGLTSNDQVILDYIGHTDIDEIRTYKVTFSGRTVRAFWGASDLRIFRNAFAVPVKSGHVFGVGKVRARALIADEKKRVAAAIDRAAAARQREKDEFEVRSFFETLDPTSFETDDPSSPPTEPLEEVVDVIDPPVPAVSNHKSITPDYLICLEDGGKFKSLRRHLATLGMTPEQYREKWNLSADYPMLAPNYAAQRSELAKSIGFGQSRKNPVEIVPPSARLSPPRSR
jgi:hypothetical protein